MFDWFKKKEKSAGDELKNILSGYELPSFPAVVMNALSMLRDPDSSLQDISMQVEMDAGMHVKVLKTVNSAAFGLCSEVSNMSHAISLLGRSRLESILLSVAAKDAVPLKAPPQFDIDEFWLASAKRASLARSLALRLHPASQAESFTAGLLQDIAVLVLAEVNGEKYNDVFSQWVKEPSSRLDELERAAFGYDHAGIGALMMDEWGLPGDLARMIAGHMDPSKNDNVPPAVRLVSYIRVGDADDGREKLIDACNSEYDLDRDELSVMVERSLGDAVNFHKMM